MGFFLRLQRVKRIIIRKTFDVIYMIYLQYYYDRPTAYRNHRASTMAVGVVAGGAWWYKVYKSAGYTPWASGIPPPHWCNNSTRGNKSSSVAEVL